MILKNGNAAPAAAFFILQPLILKMQFTNASLAMEDLPSVAELQLQPASAAYYKVLRIEWLLSSLFFFALAGALIFFIPSLRQSWGWMVVSGVAILLSIIILLSVELGFRWLAFAVREKDVASRKGWFIRSTRIAPFNRIQNCTVQSGPLERRFGLSSLIIYTAGNDNADLRISGLPTEEAERLRHYILENIHSATDENL